MISLLTSPFLKVSVAFVDGDIIIDEIVIVCRKLVFSETPQGHITRALEALTQAVLDQYSRNKQPQCLHKIIGCLRDALKTCSSNFHRVPLQPELAKLLVARFLALRVDDDYQEAKKVLDVITPPRFHQAIPDEYHIQASTLTTALGLARSIVYSNIDDWEGAVSRCYSFLDNCQLFGDPLHPVITELLASHAERVSKRFGPLQGTQAARLEADLLSSAQLGTFSDGIDVQTVPPLTVVEEKIEDLQHLCSTTLPGTERQRKCLTDLARCYNVKAFLTQDVVAMEEAIKCRRMLLATTHPTDKSKFTHLFALGGYLFEAFDRTRRFEYLDESITHYREVLRMENARLFHFTTTRRLVESLSTRWQLFHHKSDLDETMELFSKGVKDTQATAPLRFELACHWVDAARISEHDSLAIAYECSMSVMQSSLVFAPTLPTQHDRLVEKRDLYEKTPLDFASYQIEVGELKRAIEILEQGRALLWSEMRGFRTSTDRLRAADLDIAKKFTAIDQELETLTTSVLSNGSVETVDGAPNDELIGQLSGLMKREHELYTKRDALISQIRDQLGIEDFLLPLPFDTLRSAASRGPVIVINHCKWRSDVIIVLHDSPPSHIPMPSNFFDRANELKVRLLTTREEYGLNSGHYEDALAFVLAELYTLIGQQVIKKLTELRIPAQSRVWWCPTSAFGYLPLHAMGPISSDGGELRYFSDLYVSSYTPTLSALLASREPATQPSDPSPPGAWPDAQVIRDLDLQATSLGRGNATLATILDGLQRHRFVYIAYNGELKAGRPFEASIRFPNGEYLTLLDFVRTQHPAGEFALLPGSHTAELTEGSIPDEALHLSAAVQYSGFRSVIGTLWEMDDDGGRDVEKAVFQSLFSGHEGGVPYYERSARALRDAVQQMRRNLPLVRWVGYVHYGA
jgi:CHAT domain